MIRQAAPGDRGAIFELWQRSFGDDKSYIDFFLDHGFVARDCLVWDENGRPAAMLHLRLADFFDGKTEFPAAYIYAAATLPEFRGRGIMAALIGAAQSAASARGCRFTFLLPGSDSLYGYYARLGFKEALFVKKAELSRKELERLAENRKTAASGEEISADWRETDGKTEIYALRREFFRPAILWRERELSYALAEWDFTRGELLRFPGGYALARRGARGVEVREVCGDLSLAAAALLKAGGEKFTLSLPPYLEPPFPANTARYGMISADGATALTVAAAKPYVNLMLE